MLVQTHNVDHTKVRLLTSCKIKCKLAALVNTYPTYFAVRGEVPRANDPHLVLYYVNYTTVVMGKSNNLTSNLNVVKDLCEELEGFFEAFQMDKYWDEGKNKVTIAFTCERMQPRYLPN